MENLFVGGDVEPQKIMMTVMQSDNKNGGCLKFKTPKLGLC